MSIYRKFCTEFFDENSKLQKIKLDFPDNFNFGYDVVDAIAKDFPDKRALVWCNTENKEKILTFSQISTLSNKAANVFKSAGLKKGDRVLVVLKRHYEYWIVAVALHKLGVTLIPATHMLTESDYAYRIASADVKAIICTCDNNVPQKLKTALQKANKCCLLWCVRNSAEDFVNLSEKIDAAPEEFERIETHIDDPMLLYFTSGTTGQPKGVIHNFSYPLAHIVTAKYWHGAMDNGLHFTVAETGWAKASWGKIYGQWLVGCAVMVYDFDNFDPKQLVHIINKYGVTSFCAPPTVYRYLVRKGIAPMPKLKYATTAGEKLASDVFEKFTAQTGIKLREGYGQTETALLLANFIDSEPKMGSMGTISPLYNIALQRKDGTKANIGEIGEIVIIPDESGRTVGVFSGYLDNEEQYKRCWKGGVYHTSDAAFVDENGNFWFHGRFDDIIKTGGFRVGPYEIENILAKHDAVKECSVIGVPDALRGQAIKAVIVLSKHYSKSAELERDIKEFCNKQLAEYKWIRMIEFVDELPKTISGKTIKAQLRENS